MSGCSYKIKTCLTISQCVITDDAVCDEPSGSSFVFSASYFLPSFSCNIAVLSWLRSQSITWRESGIVMRRLFSLGEITLNVVMGVWCAWLLFILTVFLSRVTLNILHA